MCGKDIIVFISKIKQKGGANEVNPLKALNKSIKKFKLERVDYKNALLNLFRQAIKIS
jgi:hypothetical protein